MKALEILRGMRELLSDPAALCKRAQARDRQGNAIPWSHPEACAWCLVWSPIKVANGMTYATEDAVRALRAANGGVWLLDWNDAPERTHAEVLTLIDRAIEQECSRS